MISLFRTSLLVFQGLLAFSVGYLLILTAFARRADRRTRLQRDDPTIRFLILIPAHNEERLLPGLLQSLDRLDYPESLYSVHVVADNCTDQTAAVAEQAGAEVYIRQDKSLRGKGYALQWLLERLWAAGELHDAVVILDADSIVSPNFLRVMATRLAQGERVIQAYYTVRDPEGSWAGGLRFAALSAVHYLRPQGRMVLGGSAGLKGNGMVFSADVLKDRTWPASLTEDIEFHMALLLDGERVTFAPDAIVLGEMPSTLTNSSSQNTRWEQGRLQMARRYVPQLLRASWSERKPSPNRRSFMLFDAAMEHVIPPFSVLAGLTAMCSLLSLFLSAVDSRPSPSPQAKGARSTTYPNILLSIGLILGQALYLLAGLRLVKAPRRVYLSLFHIPKYVLWKLWLIMQILLGRGQEEWVRTKRNEA